MASSLSQATRRDIDLGRRGAFGFNSLPALAEQGFGRVSRLPRSLAVVLESVLRNCDERRYSDGSVRDLASWRPDAPRTSEIPFTVGRLVLNCAAGIPLLGDLTAMRGAVSRLGHPAAMVAPQIPVAMALDHTLTVDFNASADALSRNMALEFERNAERFRFVKWAMDAYSGIRLFPPGTGILHQLNLEVMAPGLLFKDGLCFPDTLVGTDSHTCMIAGLGVVGWGVGGIEAETAVLGRPVYVLTPDVLGVHVSGRLGEGVTATDLVLHTTEMLRQAKVVGEFVEFFGEAVSRLTVPDRATISNMAPEYGATIGYFPVDEQTCRYLRQTGRPDEDVAALERYFRAQGLFGAPLPGEVDYTRVLELDLGSVVPNLAGPKRPQDRVPLSRLKARFAEALRDPSANGYGKSAPAPAADVVPDMPHAPRDGDVVIAAITSCTNTSNPGVMLAAGLVARNAVRHGLRTKPWVKTSLTPGSVVVGQYLRDSGLQADLDRLGFDVAGFSCATCVGASGSIDRTLEAAIAADNVVACAVLSGNRNFEGRIHPAVKAAFLASPPLVVAFAIAGRVDIDMASEPLGRNRAGQPVYLRDIWPGPEEIEEAFSRSVLPDLYRDIYAKDPTKDNAAWTAIPHPSGDVYPWDESSSYLKEPPFLDAEFQMTVVSDIIGARPLAILGDSVTTDHISPIGTIKASSPAGTYLTACGVAPADFNNYGARRMNHDVMLRGAFSNARLKNRMVPGIEGGVTAHHPSGERMSIFDAAERYRAENRPLIIVAGEEYGTGSARDWAAKATRLLGVRAVVAESFERIHRSNLVGMGVLPLQLPAGMRVAALDLDGTEIFDVTGLGEEVEPGQSLDLAVRRMSGHVDRVAVKLRLDTDAEVQTALHGGLMPYVFAELVDRARAA